MQHRITHPSKLLDKHGELIQKGYATYPILEYNRENVARKLRLKEWDYYLIQNNNYFVALTVGTTPGIGIISASFIDLNNIRDRTKTIVRVFPCWRVKMPTSSESGDIIYRDSRVSAEFKYADNVRLLNLEMKDFEAGMDFKASILLTDEPKDSMVIATPFKQSNKQFFYNRKIIGMRASGEVQYKGKVFRLSPDDSFGLLDWGRGVWPHKATWYWSAAQGIINGNVFGFNLGYGFGDTSAATENMLFYDGIASKLEKVVFIIPKNKSNQYEYLKPWIITSSDWRIEMCFNPIIDRSVNLNALVLSTEQHQVFGRFTGRAILDDGKVIAVKDLLGFAERVENRW
ncbi:MAG: DUF2804 domain-containing protein [Bacillota bacterium]